MERNSLVRTGHESTVVTFGAFALGYVGQDEADRAIQLALDYGVNHVDIAPSYGHSMEQMAPRMPEIPDSVFLGSKTGLRTRDEPRRDVESIMKRMNVDDFELFQLHSVGTLNELDRVPTDSGALEPLVETREQGLAKWLGIADHGPSIPSTIQGAAMVRLRCRNVPAESGDGA